jgi:hypothetical protein
LKKMTATEHNNKESICWICSKSPADSREHIFKASDLKTYIGFKKNDSRKSPLHFGSKGHKTIQGPKSDQIKYKASICNRCNSTVSQPFDKAYEKFSTHLSEIRSYKDELDFTKIYGDDFFQSLTHLHKYFIKSMGCRIIDSGALLPDFFPNLISNENIERHQFSLCWNEPIKNSPNYNSDMGYKILGKGTLYANCSRSYIYNTEEKKVLKAVWWENLGKIQITHWFNIDNDPSLGEIIKPSKSIYSIVINAWDLNEMNEHINQHVDNNPSSKFVPY